MNHCLVADARQDNVELTLSALPHETTTTTRGVIQGQPNDDGGTSEDTCPLSNLVTLGCWRWFGRSGGFYPNSSGWNFDGTVHVAELDCIYVGFRFFISVLLVVFNPPGGRLDPWSLTFGLLASVSTAHDGGRWGWIVVSVNL